ncbi:NADH dehydrogenase [ubiquinone] 1 beta subcomplex subunit 7 [Cimex lectularius]|uniref:NADH dehydrogenase [ubiquinone] 1 beta subcomplex subunit 7 n=1 Tax=Cimex lectularius TaxID=79782 RepID=A0A8I6RTI0_CIMLE|nr:NADH dehydrogenase [ubiquinone] 1 beta subcomplex subunit 7 [Cimex lectularius]
MGNLQNGAAYKFSDDPVPHPSEPAKFDPLYGFPNGRKEKEMKATQDELYSAKVPLDKRDYCSHLLLDYQKCRRANFPFILSCHHDKHMYLQCEYEDYLDRMKDYERERRLMERSKRATTAGA